MRSAVVCFIACSALVCVPQAVEAQLLPPATVTATASAPGQVTVSWDLSSGATSYNVYRSFNPLVFLTPMPVIAADATKVASGITGGSWVDTGRESLVRYFYTVTAQNSEGESIPNPFAQPEVITTAAPNATIWGIADTHSHQFSNLGFGEIVVWGQPYNPNGLKAALDWCLSLHGIAGLADYPGAATPQGVGHAVGGFEEFDGWPKWNTYTHQQMHVDWLYRAFIGGVKLVVVHAVNNETLCEAVKVLRGFPPTLSCNDMEAVDRQIAAAWDVATHVPWYRIARSAAEARQIINSGKLAVVLGIEVDFLFNCRPGTCNPTHVKQQLKKYYDLGVRHIHPIHLFDNAFGGAAIFDDAVNYGNRIANGAFFSPRDCAAEGYAFTTQPAGGIAGFIAWAFGLGNPEPTGFGGDCNPTGLTALGDSLLNKMMSRKMIIDVDHLSKLAMDTALTKFESFRYPVISGHTGFVDTSNGAKRTEAQKTESQVDRIRNLGGFVSPLTHQGDKHLTRQWGNTIANDCSHSSKTFAQAYLYAVEKMQGGAVGLATDFNGFAGQPGPRFGGDECPEDDPVSAQSGGVTYPFAPFGKPGSLGKSVVGKRVFDYDVDGLAHVGLIPDLIQDLRSLGLSTQLNPLFNSAEAYIKMWEAAERTNIFPPSLTFAVAPGANLAGWNRADVTVTATGAENSTGDGWAVQRIEYSATGAQTIPSTTVTGATASASVSTEGITTFRGTATDEVGNVSPVATRVVKLDKTAPAVNCGAADGLWHATDVSISCSASDATSGLATSADAAFTLITNVPSGTETSSAVTDSRSVLDVAGNSSAAGPVGNNKVDKKAPSITISSPTTAVYILNQPVPAAYACTDGGSGLATCAGPVASGSNFTTTGAGTHSFVVNATDAVANASNAAVSYVVSYDVCLLYDPTRARPAGSNVPIKFQLCDFTRANVSSAGVVVTATGLTQLSTNAPGPLEDSGAANADNNFRFDATLGGYVYNLKTTGLATGTYRLTFTAAGDPTVHNVEFQIK